MTQRDLPLDELMVGADIQTAKSLPPHAFTDPRVLQLELQTVFNHNWLALPQRTDKQLGNDPRSLREIIEAPGSNVPLSLLDEPLFLQRDQDLTLRCFPNVCTHAWYPLVHAPGNATSIVCQQHGRKFGCDGTFLSHGGFSRTTDNELRQAASLPEIPFATWHQFFFAAFKEPSQTLENVLHPVADTLGELDPGKFIRAPMPIEERLIEGNWKLHACNYMDQFHIPFIHRGDPGLAEQIDTRSYTTELHHDAALQWAYAKNPEHGFAPDLLPSRFQDPQDGSRRVFALWWFVFPNLTLNFYPWGLSVNMYHPEPRNPMQTRFFWYHYVFDTEKYEYRDSIWHSDRVDEEDVVAIARVNRNLSSRFSHRGTFSADREMGPHWFHHRVSRDLLSLSG